jgi:HSP20 family molecular chaperone IbpA
MRDPANWMLSEAIDALARAERMHRQLFQIQQSQTSAPAWEPPLDMIETQHEVLVLIALPGVEPDQVEAVIREGILVVAGRRVLPPELRMARIHRLELPQGRFERHIPLPPGRYRGVRRLAQNGCLVFSLEKDA